MPLFVTLTVRRIRPKAWIFACLSGVLQILIFPNFSIYLLSWVALAPLIYAILKCRDQDIMMVLADGGQFLAPATAWQGFLLGYVCGFLWYLGSCSWIFHVMHVYGGIGTPLSVLLLVMFSLYLGLYHGLFGLLLALIAARRNQTQPARPGIHALPVGRGGDGARLHHRLPLGPAGHDADRQHPAFAHGDRNRRLRNFVRDRAGQHRCCRGIPCSVAGARCC